MMNKKKSLIFTSIRYLMVVPAAMVFLLGSPVQATTKFSIDEISQVMDSKQEPKKKNDVYVIVEQMPSFPGGEEAMHRFLTDNIKYPVEARNKGIKGRVIVRFIVRSTGEISNISILRGVDPILDEEAMRVIESMPKWEPGKQNHETVDVYYTLPIIFNSAGSYNVNTSEPLNKITSTEEIAIVPSIEEIVSLKENSASDETKPFIQVEQMPSFPGGEAAMQEFILKNMKYPAEAQANGIQGRVTIRFVVKSTGDISDVCLLRGVDPALDNEALRVINLMPKWIPGRNNGHAVDVYFTIPMAFRLPGKAEESTILFVFDGKIISNAECMEMVNKAKAKPNSLMMEIVENGEAIKKYGKIALGKRVVELKKNEKAD